MSVTYSALSEVEFTARFLPAYAGADIPLTLFRAAFERIAGRVRYSDLSEFQRVQIARAFDDILAAPIFSDAAPNK